MSLRKSEAESRLVKTWIVESPWKKTDCLIEGLGRNQEKHFGISSATAIEIPSIRRVTLRTKILQSETKYKISSFAKLRDLI